MPEGPAPVQTLLREPAALDPRARRGGGPGGARPARQGPAAARQASRHGLGAGCRSCATPSSASSAAASPRGRTSRTPSNLEYFLATGCAKIAAVADVARRRLGPRGRGHVLPRRARQARRRSAVRGRRALQERPEPVDGDGLHGAAPRADERARGLALLPVRRGDRREPWARGGRRARAGRPRAVPRVRSQGRRGSSTSCSYRDEVESARARDQRPERGALRARRARGRIRPPAAARGRLRGRRPDAGPRARKARSADVRGRRHDHPGAARGARGRLGAGDHPARRQPGRLGDGVRRDLAGGAACAPREAGRRLDGRLRRLGRLLRGDGRGRDRGPARARSPARSASSRGSSACAACTPSSASARRR